MKEELLYGRITQKKSNGRLPPMGKRQRYYISLDAA